MTADHDTGRVTVVVATRNRRETLLRTLARREAPTLVVDNGSMDGTAEAVRHAHPDVQVIRLAVNLGAAGRNVGAARATTPYVAFADDDSYWAPGSLADAARLLDAYPRAALLSAQVRVGEEARLDPISEAMATAPLGWPSDLPGPAILGFLACAVVVRRSAFLAVGGFNELLGCYGEEDMLALDLVTAGWGLAYVERLVVHHHPAGQRGTSRARCIQETRNRLLTAWLRRRAPAALRISAGAVRSALTDSATRAGLVAAARHGLRAVPSRRPVPPHVERQLAVLEEARAMRGDV